MLDLLASSMRWQDSTTTTLPDDSVVSVADELTDDVVGFWDQFVAWTPRLLVAVIIVFVGFVLAKVVNRGVRRAIGGDDAPDGAIMFRRLLKGVIVLMAVLIAITVVMPEFSLKDLFAGIGIFSVAAGFAFQDILENMLAGLLLLFGRPFKVGDEIEVADRFGIVTAISVRETQLRTFDGQMFIIPNRDVYKSVVRVQTAFAHRRLSFDIGIDYDEDLTKVLEVIEDALDRVHDDDPDLPSPSAKIVEFGPSSVIVACRVWSNSNHTKARKKTTAAMIEVLEALQDSGIGLPSDIVALQATPSLADALAQTGRGGRQDSATNSVSDD